MKQFEKTIKFIPGFDYVVNGPKAKAKYGRHGLDIVFILKGDKGAITFSMSTGWMPMLKVGMSWEPTFKRHDTSGTYPMATDIGYHSPKPLYDYHDKPSQKKCLWLNKPCYYDGSSLYAEEFMAEFFNKGEEAIWKKMEEYYKERFT